MRRLAGFILILLYCSALAPIAWAQSALFPPVIRYHFGDDPDGARAWASPALDDSAWPLASHGKWPEPPFDSSGFVWVRILATVPSDTAEPLALRIGSATRVWSADEVFVNGVRVGTFGSLPPHPFVDGLPSYTVFNLPTGLAHPSAIVHVALRIWYPPFVRPTGSEQVSAQSDSGGPTAIEAKKKPYGHLDAASFAFDQSRTLHAEQSAARDQARLLNVLPLALNCLILLIGIAVLVLARSYRSRDLFLYGAMIATLPGIPLFFELVAARFVILSEPQAVWLQVISQLPAMLVTIEFIWRINQLNDVWFKRLTYTSMALFNVAVLVAFTPSTPLPIVPAALVGYRIALQSFNVLTIGANLWVIFFKRKRLSIAFAMLLVPAASLAEGFRNTSQNADLFDLAFFSAALCLTAVLIHQAWKEWRAHDALKAEIDAARELQQRLVSPAIDVPAFRIESAYIPATHVGGDFFYLRPEDDGGVLVVVGDVSGKGLRAAMTVNSVMGALRTMPSLPPQRILASLNRGLVGQMQNGFVTCLAALISADGVIALANAGHLAPYRNGEEVPVESSLPLGISPDAAYTESTLQLAPNDQLTFLSDGVVEATSPSGALLGFDRTAAISTQSAGAIAQAAQQFGQEDDITVLTLQYAPAEVLHA